MNRLVVTVEGRTTPETIRAVRALIKRLGRTYRLRCVRLDIEPPTPAVTRARRTTREDRN